MTVPGLPIPPGRIHVVRRAAVESRPYEDESLLNVVAETVRMASILERIEQLAEDAVWPGESHLALDEIRWLLSEVGR